MNKVEEVVKTFESGFNCSQAVISTYAPDLGLKRELALLVSSGFGGGLGRIGEVCGAVTGAIMALGLKYGFTTFSSEAKEEVHNIVREYIARFKEKNSSILCRELLGADINTPDGKKEFILYIPR
ncbi:MAG: C-GCAxxG-C-C family protein [bacterium]